MRKIIVAAASALTLSACGSAATQKVTSNPSVQKDVTQAESEVSACFSKNFNLASRPVRVKFEKCIGHGRSPAQVQACVAKVVGQDLPLHHKRFVQDTAKACVLA